MPMFQCQLCHSKILENRLQKHHAKVHANIDHDIYTPLATDDASNVNSTQVNDPCWSEHITPAADEKMVHVSCNICSNRMPIDSLDQHMKRKHSDAGDQVDAVGTNVNSMSIDVTEKAENVATSNHRNKQAEELTIGWPKVKNPFSSSFRFTAIPKMDASTMIDSEEASKPSAYYTIRVSADQMKQLMTENRIDPKDGYFYLK